MTKELDEVVIAPVNGNLPEDSYTEKDVALHTDAAHIRLRPGVYIGELGTKGLHHLVYELVANSVDEALAGYAKHVSVRIYADGGLSVSDDGRGIPVEEHAKEKISTLELVMTRTGAGAKFGKGTYKVSGGLHGMGAKAVTALSEWTEARVYRQGRIFVQEYERGKATTPVRDVGPSEHTGTRIWFRPDPEFFQGVVFDYDILEDRLRELAFLNKGLMLALHDERTHHNETFKYDGGVAEFVKWLNRTEDALHSTPILIEKTVDGVQVEIAMQYTRGEDERGRCYTNNALNIDGGTHLTGFRTGLTRSLNAYGTREGLFKNVSPIGEDFRDGLTLVISVQVPEPTFNSQEKRKLMNAEVEGVVSSVVSETLSKHLEENPKEAQTIMRKVVTAAEAREAASKAKKALKDRKSILSGGGLPGKLYDCSNRDPDSSELFLVEGDSAGGSAESGREREFQAILPLRGKPLNVEKARLENLLKNEEISNLISAIGIDIGNNDDISKLRYGKIIIMSVAGDEPTLVAHKEKGLELVRIGAFIDDCIAGRRDPDHYQTICFDPQTNAVRYRPLKAVIRHPHQEAMYRLVTRYNRSVKVTSSHSVYVYEEGQVRLKKGNEVREGDLLVATRRLPRTPHPVERIDLLRTLHGAGLTRGLYLHGEDVRAAAAQRVRERVSRPDRWEEQVGSPVCLVPRTQSRLAFDRFLPVTHELMWFLGWFVAEGTLSAHQVSLNLGSKDERFFDELTAAVQKMFGETPRIFRDPDSDGIKFYFHSVLAARLLRAWGVANRAHRKTLPDLVFNVSEELQRAFLEGYFLGDGTTGGQNLAFVTSSADLKEGLLYLFGQLGLLASVSRHAPAQDMKIQTRHPYYSLALCGKEQLEATRSIWQRHANASLLEQHLTSPRRKVSDVASISEDLIGLKVLKAEEIEPVGDYVYDFSVEDDENFVCGSGGLACHNTDADVDGQHIRTLLLTFFYRQMSKLVAEGKIYVARPPLYKVVQKKETRFVQTAEEMQTELMDRGLRGTRLTIYPPPPTDGSQPAAPVVLEGDELSALMKKVTHLESSLEILERSGLNMNSFVLRAGQRGFPLYRFLVAGREEFCYTPEEALAFRQEQERQGRMLATDDLTGAAPTATNGHANGSAETYREQELHEVRKVNKDLEELRKYGLNALDLAPAPRIAGREPPVRLVLENSEHKKSLLHLRILVGEVRKLGERGMTITRFKGLGEMDPAELWDTTLDPEKRTLLRVQLEDVIKADEIFRILMGEKVEPRRDFIMEHANKVKDLDLNAG
jgi:DNA gyrase/topoisomerase IV subunit B/intein/homing endonuclease